MFKHYLTTALRNYRASPYITLVNLVSLSLGLACFLSAWGAVNYLRASDSQFENHERIYAITRERVEGAEIGASLFVPPPVAKHLRSDFPELEAVARLMPQGEMVLSAGGTKIFARTSFGDPDFLKIFRLPFVHGDSRNALRPPLGVIVTNETAVKLFGRSDVVGRTLLLENALNVSITGVVGRIPRPSQFADTVFKQGFDAIVSFDTAAALYRSQGIEPWTELPDTAFWRSFAQATYVLLPSDGKFALSDLKRGLEKFGERHIPEAQREESNSRFGPIPMKDVSLTALDSGFFGSTGLSIAWLLPLLGSVVLLVATFNYANLAIAQALRRAKEIGMRRVLGASRVQVATQYFFEAALLTAAAFMLAMLFIALVSPLLYERVGLSIRLLPAQLFSEDMIAAVGFFVGVFIVTALAAAAYPALVLTRARPELTLRGGGSLSRPVPRLLVGLQFCIVSAFLIAALTIAAQNNEMRRTGLRDDSTHTLAVTNYLPNAKVNFTTLRTELLKYPAIKSVAGLETLPWTGLVRSFEVSQPSESRVRPLDTFFHKVSGDYLDALGIRILAGRSFSSDITADIWPDYSDNNSGETRNVVVARSLISHMGWQTENEALGKLLTVNGRSARVIGVTEDQPLRLTGMGASSGVFLYSPEKASFALVRVSADQVREGVGHVASVWNALSPQTPFKYRFVDDLFDEQYRSYQTIYQLILGITTVAITISAFGLFGIAVFAANRRQREIGVRKTLGASVGQIVMMLLRDFSKPVLIAGACSWPIAYIAMQAYLSIFTNRIELTPMPFVLSLLISVAVACLSVVSQTLRAAQLNPATVLRYE